MSKKLIALSLALVMLLALCLSGCASNNANNGGNGGNGGSEDGDGGATKDTLVIAHQVDCGDMNPHGLTSFDYWKIKAQCYEPLFRLDFETNEIIPLLATGYEWIDNQTLQINLREGVQFHNGLWRDDRGGCYVYPGRQCTTPRPATPHCRAGSGSVRNRGRLHHHPAHG